MLAANRALGDVPGDAKFARERQMLRALAGMCEYYFSTDRTSSEAEQLRIISRQFLSCCEAELL